MNDSPSRRDFLATCGTGLAASLAGARVQDPAQDRPKPRLRLALNLAMVRAQTDLAGKFRLAKEAGFDGIELNCPSSLSNEDIVAASTQAKLPVHGVVDSVHWQKCLSDPDAKVRAAGVAGLRAAIEGAHACGAKTVLLVPGRVTRRVRYDQVYERSQKEIRKVLPLAAERRVKIAIENVWNRFLLSPLEFARYVDELESPWVGAYFDAGNVIKYCWPEQWVEILGKRIVRVHIKGYSHKRGFGVSILQGDCDWKRIMQALHAVGYREWLTAEVRGGGPKRLAEIAAALETLRDYAG